jgi:hypothetical protein
VDRVAVNASSSGEQEPFDLVRSCSHPSSSILRAFLVEEAKIVKKVIKSQQKK